jgi:hypothetical protein
MDALYSSVLVGAAFAWQHAQNVNVSMALVLEPPLEAVLQDDTKPADFDQRYPHGLLPSYRSIAALPA